jgi:hypothetical protein
MRPPPEDRQARQEHTLHMLAEARACIARIGAAAAPQLSAGTRHAARQLAVLAQARLAALHALPPHTGETWVAAANFAIALRSVEMVIDSPEERAGLAKLFKAQDLLGAAFAQGSAAARLAGQRRKGGSVTDPDSKAERIRTVITARPTATSGQVAAAVAADSRQVRKVKARTKP